MEWISNNAGFVIITILSMGVITVGLVRIWINSRSSKTKE